VRAGVKNLSWGGYSGQLEVGFDANGTVTCVTLWQRWTEWDGWRMNMCMNGWRIFGCPSLITWEKGGS